VVRASRMLFGDGELRDADRDTLGMVAAEVPVHAVTREALAAGVPVVDALIGTGLASSKADARRGLSSNGYSVNGEKLGPERTLGAGDLLADRFIVLQKGKKHYAIIDAG